MKAIFYALYSGFSDDGRGPGTYVGCTDSRDRAVAHWETLLKDPYTTGKVVAYGEDTVLEISPYECCRHLWGRVELDPEPRTPDPATPTPPPG